MDIDLNALYLAQIVELFGELNIEMEALFSGLQGRDDLPKLIEDLKLIRDSMRSLNFRN